MVTGEESMRQTLNADSEIISLSPRPSCPKPTRFPIENTLALYGSWSAKGPLLCGFSEQEKGCFKYQILENNWELQQFVLLENRSRASSVSYENDTWIIIGGQDYDNGLPVVLNTSEILRNCSFTQGPNLPTALSGHCSVKSNLDHIFIVGGYGKPHLKDVFILNIKEFTWQYLPLMKYGRFGHACGKVMTSFKEIEIIVAGGLHQNRIEKYSLVHSKWFTLPMATDQPIFKSATVQGETTFIITGGVELEPDCTTSNCRQDIIRIYDNYVNVLKHENIRLNHGRGNHIATPIPFDIICSGTLSSLSAD